jgi:hypothetical protein
VSDASLDRPRFGGLALLLAVVVGLSCSGFNNTDAPRN